jgi:homoserine O-acetyltransferase
MKKYLSIFTAVVLVVLSSGFSYGEGTLKYADLGDFPLENGQTIRGCRLGYRTFGVLNQERSNAILFPTWFGGTTEELVRLNLVGPGRLADSSKYFIVAVDALGNGVSSSPSTSTMQPARAFPRFSTRDIVNAQYTLLTKHLQLGGLYAVMGISMGGMQAYQWAVSYPQFVRKVVPIAGTPRLSSYDLLLWQAELRALDVESSEKAMRAVADIHTLALRTPRYIARNTEPADFPQFLAAAEEGIMKYDRDNWASQLRSMVNHDIYRQFGNSMDEAAKAMKARTLVVTSRQDHMVFPEPSQIFSLLTRAETFELTGDCGHLAFLCEEQKLRAAVARFLAK